MYVCQLHFLRELRKWHKIEVGPGMPSLTMFFDDVVIYDCWLVCMIFFFSETIINDAILLLNHQNIYF